MKSKTNPVVHFEMPYEDPNRLTKFYSEAFGWNMEQVMGDYVLAGTAEMDENNMVKTPGTINGGFFKKGPETPSHPSFVIAVDDIKEGMNKVKQAGGTVKGEPVEIQGIGMYVSFTDSEGNHVSMLQPRPM